MKKYSLQNFIDNGRTLAIAWLNLPFEVYVRKGVRFFEGKAYTTFERDKVLDGMSKQT